MRRRRLLLGAVGLLALVSCVVFVWLAVPRYTVNRESFERLDQMMGNKATLPEVEAILGGPAHNYGRFEDDSPWRFYHSAASDGLAEKEGWQWFGEDLTIIVYLEDGRMTGLSQRAGRPESVWTRLCRLIPW